MDKYKFKLSKPRLKKNKKFIQKTTCIKERREYKLKHRYCFIVVCAC